MLESTLWFYIAGWVQCHNAGQHDNRSFKSDVQSVISENKGIDNMILIFSDEARWLKCAPPILYLISVFAPGPIVIKSDILTDELITSWALPKFWKSYWIIFQDADEDSISCLAQAATKFRKVSIKCPMGCIIVLRENNILTEKRILCYENKLKLLYAIERVSLAIQHNTLLGLCSECDDAPRSLKFPGQLWFLDMAQCKSNKKFVLPLFMLIQRVHHNLSHVTYVYNSNKYGMSLEKRLYFCKNQINFSLQQIAENQWRIQRTRITQNLQGIEVESMKEALCGQLMSALARSPRKSLFIFDIDCVPSEMEIFSQLITCLLKEGRMVWVCAHDSSMKINSLADVKITFSSTESKGNKLQFKGECKPFPNAQIPILPQFLHYFVSPQPSVVSERYQNQVDIIIEMTLQGHTEAQIAQKLDISIHTLRQIKRRFGIRKNAYTNHKRRTGIGKKIIALSQKGMNEKDIAHKLHIAPFYVKKSLTKIRAQEQTLSTSEESLSGPPKLN